MARYKGGSSTGSSLRYPVEAYVPSVVMMSKYMTEKQMISEYSRLRSIARKRLERFEGTEWVDTQQYRMNAGRYKPVKEIKNKTELVALLSDVSRFVTARTGSVSGLQAQRRQSIQSLHEHGYTFVNRKNFKQFAEFMEDWRTWDKNRLYDSARVADLYHEAKKKQIPLDQLKRDFEFWLEENNLEALQNMKRISKKPHSAADYKKAILKGR